MQPYSETEELKKELEEWLHGRPKIIREMADKLKPWLRYRLKTTGQHCTLYSFSENGTVTITIDGHDSEDLNIINQSIQIKVFGINPDDLELLIPEEY